MAGEFGHSIKPRVFHSIALPYMLKARPILQRSLGQQCIRPYFIITPKILLYPRRTHFTHQHHGHDHGHSHAQFMQTLTESGQLTYTSTRNKDLDK